MTGGNAILFMVIAFFATVFIGKLILRLASRPVVKNYVTIPSPAQNPPVGYFYPQFVPPMTAVQPEPAAADVEPPRCAERSSPTEEDAFKQLVRDYYEL